MSNNFQRAFQNMGEAQILAVQGNQEIGRMIADAVGRLMRRTFARLPGLRARFA